MCPFGTIWLERVKRLNSFFSFICDWDHAWCSAAIHFQSNLTEWTVRWLMEGMNKRWRTSHNPIFSVQWSDRVKKKAWLSFERLKRFVRNVHLSVPVSSRCEVNQNVEPCCWMYQQRKDYEKHRIWYFVDNLVVWLKHQKNQPLNETKQSSLFRSLNNFWSLGFREKYLLHCAFERVGLSECHHSALLEKFVIVTVYSVLARWTQSTDSEIRWKDWYDENTVAYPFSYAQHNNCIHERGNEYAIHSILLNLESVGKIDLKHPMNSLSESTMYHILFSAFELWTSIVSRKKIHGTMHYYYKASSRMQMYEKVSG